MTPENRQATVIILIFVGMIAACGAAVWLGFAFFTGQRNVVTAVLTPEAPPLVASEGVVITAVTPNSPGALAGLQPGHIITEANDVPINDTETLQNVVATLAAGSEIQLILLVDGEKRQTTAVRAAEPPFLGIEIIDREAFTQLPTVPPPTPIEAPTSEPATGIPAVLAIVDEVVADSPAEEAGLQVGDVITAVNGQAILSSAELVEQLGEFFPGDTLVLTLRRGAETLTRSVVLGEHPDDGERPFLGIVLQN